MSEGAAASRIDRLLDAIELVESGQREAALPILRQLVQEDSNLEDAWLWMSVAVDSMDKSAVCLDNVLRINPRNQQAAAALHRLREAQIARETRISRLRATRDAAWVGLWLLVLGILFAGLFTFASMMP